MKMDPVVLLAEDLRATEAALDKATKLYARDRRREDGELVSLLLERIKRLYHDIYETVPTSALGAAELVRMAARRLPFAHARYASHLHGVAERLSDGHRLHSDLIWLRALEAAFADGVCGKDGGAIAPWLHLAVIGASRPVLVYRAVESRTANPTWKDVLARLETGRGQEAQRPS